MKNVVIVILSILLCLTLVWTYSLKSQVDIAISKGAACEMQAESLRLSSAAK